MGEGDRMRRDSSIRIFEDRCQFTPNSDVESGHQITFIPAKILTVDKQADKHRVIVRILLRKHSGSFDALMFGENKPLIGSCHDGRLDLIYHRDPGLKEGQPFPLWTMQ